MLEEFMGGSDSDADSLVSVPRSEDENVRPCAKALPPGPCAIKDADDHGDDDEDDESDEDHEDESDEESEEEHDSEDDTPNYEVADQWASRVSDTKPADQVEKARDGQAVYTWSDGDRYYCPTGVLPGGQGGTRCLQ